MILLMLVFAVLAAVGIISLGRNLPILGIGIHPIVENWIVIILSILGVIKAFSEIVRLEH